MNNDRYLHELSYHAVKILNEEQKYPITVLLRIAELSRQAYYKWLNHTDSENDKFNDLLMSKIKGLDKKHRHTLGTRKMTMYLNADKEVTETVNRKRIMRLMRLVGIKTTIQQKKHNHIRNEEIYAAENVLNQEFKVSSPNKVWVSDFTQITYGIQQEFKAKVSIVLDLHDGFVLAHNISTTETTAAAIQVFQKAYTREGNVHPLIHTDRGSAYTSKDFDRFVISHSSKRSMSRPEKPYDNAVVERWWNEFKLNWINFNVKPTSFKELIDFVDEAIQYFNCEVRSETRNGLTPMEFRNKTKLQGQEA